MEKNKFLKDFLPILYIFLIWRIALFLLGIMAMKWLPFRPSFPYAFDILAKLSPWQSIWHWANFDGPHYITIAQKGYIGTGLIQAFFPLYPLLIRLFNLIIRNSLYSGFLISNFSFLIALYFFQQLIKQEKIKHKYFPLLLLLIFPTSYYFGALYAESLFFLLTILAFLFINKKQWVRAAVFISLASATRLVGIFILPGLLWEYYQSLKKSERIKIVTFLKAFFLSVVSLTGFFWFCGFLYGEFHDPFYFVKVQQAFGASRQTDKIILLYQVCWRYFKMLFTIKNNNLLLYTIGQEFFLSIFTLVVLIIGWFKKEKKSYLFYAFGSFILPTLTGNFSSMPRYIILIFPIYFILAKIKYNFFKSVISIILISLLILNTILFLRGYWVA